MEMPSWKSENCRETQGDTNSSCVTLKEERVKKRRPVSCQTLPEGDAPISAAGQDPCVRRSFGFGAHTHIRIQAEAQQEAAQQGGVVLTVPLVRERKR